MRGLRWNLGGGGQGHLEAAPRAPSPPPQLGQCLDLERIHGPALGFPNRAQQIRSETGENDEREGKSFLQAKKRKWSYEKPWGSSRRGAVVNESD